MSQIFLTAEEKAHGLLKKIFGAATHLEERDYHDEETGDDIPSFVLDLPFVDQPGAIDNLRRFFEVFAKNDVSVDVKSEYLKGRVPPDRKTLFIAKSDFLARVDEVIADWEAEMNIARPLAWGRRASAAQPGPMLSKGDGGDGALSVGHGPELGSESGAEVVQIGADAWRQRLAARAAAKAAEGRNA